MRSVSRQILVTMKPEKAEEEVKELKPSHKKFCEEYVFDWNGTRAYKIAYPGVNDDTAGTNAARLLRNARIKAYLTEIQKDLERLSGISKLRIIKEHEKLAMSSIADLHNSWITRKEFDELTPDQKACICQIETQTRTEMGGIDGETPMQVDYVKIKLYDKQKSLDSLSKMFGYNAPEKMVHDLGTIKSFTINAASRKQGN